MSDMECRNCGGQHEWAIGLTEEEKSYVWPVMCKKRPDYEGQIRAQMVGLGAASLARNPYDIERDYKEKQAAGYETAFNARSGSEIKEKQFLGDALFQQQIESYLSVKAEAEIQIARIIINAIKNSNPH